MSEWAALLAVGLVGTARAPLPVFDASSPLRAMLAKLGCPPEQRLLAAAGVVVQWLQVGAQPYMETLSKPAPAPSESSLLCSVSAAVPLARMLRGEFPELLPEYFNLLQMHNYALPYRWLPDVLDLALRTPSLTYVIVSLLGERGRWLAAHAPRWQELVEVPDLTSWERASADVRIRLLEHARRTDPACVLSWFDTTWKQQKADTRLAWMETLREGLSMADAPFLEAALDDRSKRVRALAADLLAHLSQSSLVRRMILRARVLLTLRRDTKGELYLNVTLPEACDEALGRDGISDTPPKGVGRRIWMLEQILAVVPPSYWSEGWKSSPEALIRLADATEEATHLLSAWAWSTARHRDAAWAEALLQRWNHKRNFTMMRYLPDLVGLIQPERMDAWLTSRLHWFQRKIRSVNDVQNDFGTLDLLKAYVEPWSESLSCAVLETCRLLAQKRMRGPSPLWRWSAALPEFARYVVPGIASESAQDWPNASYWRSNIEKFQALLYFRWEMSRAFKTGETSRK